MGCAKFCFPRAGRLYRLDQPHESIRCSLKEYCHGNSCYKYKCGSGGGGGGRG